MPSKKRDPWTLRISKRSRFYEFRVSYQGVRFEESTGTPELAQAREYAVKRYTEIVGGQGRVPVRLLTDPTAPIVEVGALWLAEENYDKGPYFVYVRQWNRAFGTLKALCAKEAIPKYWRQRLGEVKWKTANKERGPLRNFLEWCERKRLITVAPKVVELPSPRKKANQGTNHKRGRNSQGVWVTKEDARAIIEALPEISESKKTPPFPIRARFEVMLQTGLRPKTLSHLSVPEHYKKGQDHLVITADIDKCSYARKLPLTPEARAALDSVCPKKGLLFGEHDYRDQLRQAAKAVLQEPEASTFTAYDFRRRALTTFGESGSLAAIAYMAGHKQMTTSSIYIRAELSSAQKMLGLETEAGTPEELTTPVVVDTPTADPAETLRDLVRIFAQEWSVAASAGGQPWGTDHFSDHKTKKPTSLWASKGHETEGFLYLCEEEDSWPSQASPRALRAIPAPNEENPALTS